MAKKRRVSLAAFLRKLWSNPKLMERFSQSKAGRAEVIRQFNLTQRHARMLLEACVRDIVLELAGATGLARNSTVVLNTEKSQADVSCGHAHCEAFMRAMGTKRNKKKR